MSLNLKAETKGALLAFTGAMFIVPDSIYVRLIDGDGLVTAFWRNVIAGLAIATNVVGDIKRVGAENLFSNQQGWCLVCHLRLGVVDQFCYRD